MVFSQQLRSNIFRTTKTSQHSTQLIQSILRSKRGFPKCGCEVENSQAIQGTILEDYVPVDDVFYNKLLTTRIHRLESVSEISDVIEKEENHLNAINLATAIFATAKLIQWGRYVRSGHPQKEKRPKQ
eukprot:TRINITY_DN109218_c0_g1_i1.p2 TRINITY_DN109218_c0_g1~~TRINITY_DN109218_c0_g1_i1.p2  ORF type:complete len:128 (+),score=9.23 TRINITY_DN109218_c0_g1_i1:33-416(+)